MIYSDTTNNLGIIQDITFKTNAGLSEYTIADRTRNINNWYMKVTGWIITADGRWRWDDTNQTNLSVATTNLVADQQDYGILSATPDTDEDWLVVERVEMDTDSDVGLVLTPFDENDKGMALTEYQKTAGQPYQYRMDGTQIFIYPKPNYDKTNGLRVYFQRAPLLFAATDTTKKPGFASPYHEILSLGATYNWEKAKGTGNPEQTMRDILDMKDKIKKHYGNTRKAYEIRKVTRPAKSYR